MADEQQHEETMGQEPIQEQNENTNEEGSGIPVASEDKSRREGDGKLFVGGLNWETTEDGLRKYFEKYGKLTDCIVMTEPHTTQSRGFGFVTFEDPSKCQDVLDAGPHTIDGRTIDPKIAVPRGGMPGDAAPEGENTKIFIGGLNPNATEESLKEHFNTFGPVSEVLLMYDRETQRPRGFGFVSFENAATVKKLVDMKFVEIDGKSVEVKAAQPKSAMGDRFGGGYGGRGRGRGRGGFYEGGRGGYGGRGRGGYDDGYGGGYGGRGGGGRGYGRGRGYDDYRPPYREDYYGGGYGAPPRDYHGGGGYGAPPPRGGGYERGGRGYDDYGGYGGNGRYASGGYDRAPERPSAGGRGGGRGGYGASSGSYSERGSSSGGYGAVGSSSADPYGDSQAPRQSAATEGYGGGGYSQGAEAGYGASAYASDGYGANAGYSNADPYASTGSYGQTSGYASYQQ